MHKDDKEFFIKMIAQITNPHNKAKASDSYNKVYQDAFDKEVSEIKKANKARFEANTRLRNYINNLNKKH